MEKRNRSLIDHKCPTCGCWMETTVDTSPKGKEIVTYFCTECGLYYSADG